MSLDIAFATNNTHTPEDQAKPGVSLGLLLPDGVGLRNFVFGSFLRPEHGKRTIHALYGVPPEAMEVSRDELPANVELHPLLQFQERPLTYVLRQCLNYAQMFWVDTFPMRLLRSRKPGGSWKSKTAVRLSRAVGYLAANPRGILFLDNLHSWAFKRRSEVAHYRELLQHIRPDVMFCTHQRCNVVIAPVLAARELGIPTATFIYSWDNLSSKGRIATPFDHYLVWSDHMRDELLKYYPDVSPNRVHVVGTPQFDPYADPQLHWSREEFFQKIGGDPSRPLICYSGGDAGNAPVDPQHIRVLLEHIRTGRIQGNPQVLLRPSPADDGKRYAEIRRDYPELIYAKPSWEHWRSGGWHESFPYPDDVAMLVNVTQHSDLNINFGSTMTLDFSLRDKPVINLAFDVDERPVYGMNMFEYLYSFEHYRPVIDFGAARCAKSAQELADHVNAYLRDPSLDRAGRKKFVDLEVSGPVGSACARIHATLDQIARTPLK
jgi:hypothetical protein